jgi:hypothetical protein
MVRVVHPLLSACVKNSKLDKVSCNLHVFCMVHAKDIQHSSNNLLSNSKTKSPRHQFEQPDWPQFFFSHLHTSLLSYHNTPCRILCSFLWCCCRILTKHDIPMDVFQNVMPTEVGISPRAQISNQRRVCTQVLFLHKAELGFFHFLEIVRGWLVVGTFRPSKDPSTARQVPSTSEDPACWKQVSSDRQGNWKYKGEIQAVLSVLTTIYFPKTVAILLTPLSVYRQYRQFRISTQTRWGLLPCTQGWRGQ